MEEKERKGVGTDSRGAERWDASWAEGTIGKTEGDHL